MEALARTFKQLGHPDRLRILHALRQGDLTVSELTQVLDLSQPRVTQYISSLEEAGLIDRLREGSWVFVRLRSGAIGGTPDLFTVVETALQSLSVEHPILRGDAERLTDVRRSRAHAAETFFARVANDQDQLSHDFLPSAPIEAALLEAAGPGPFDHLIDLGTGSGRMLQLFSDRVVRGTGIDLSPDMLRVARHLVGGANRSHLYVQLGDITATALPAASADLVTLHHVLHYLDQPATALAEAARLLRPGGTLLVADFSSHDHDAFRERFAHRRLGFSASEMDAYLSANGFQAERVKTIPMPAKTQAPDVLVWLARRTDEKRNAA